MKNKLQQKLYIILLGESSTKEAYYLDSYLSLYIDGEPKRYLSKDAPRSVVKINNRTEEKLVKDGYLKPYGALDEGFIITADGRIHLKMGGYQNKFLWEKLNRFSFWLSIVATFLSIIAVIRSF